VLGAVLTQRFHLNRVSLPLAVSSAFIGMFIGANVLGRLADRVGRGTAFLVNLGIYSALTLVGAFSVNAAMLIAARFLAGIGIGAELALIDTYLSQLLPTRVRGRYTAWAYTLGFIGVPAAGLLGRLLVPMSPLGIDGWLFVAGSLGAVIVWMVRLQLPESPRWLTADGTQLCRTSWKPGSAGSISSAFRWPPPLHSDTALSITLRTTCSVFARRSSPHFGRTTPCSIIVRPVEITVSVIGRMVQPSSFCAFAELTSSFRPT
jgi:MFS family permease